MLDDLNQMRSIWGCKRARPIDLKQNIIQTQIEIENNIDVCLILLFLIKFIHNLILGILYCGLIGYSA